METNWEELLRIPMFYMVSSLPFERVNDFFAFLLALLIQSLGMLAASLQLMNKGHGSKLEQREIEGSGFLTLSRFEPASVKEG